jgi:hypothetical protein
VPDGTTIDPYTGVATVHAPTPGESVTLTLPGPGGKLGADGSVEIAVPDGTTIDPDGGAVIHAATRTGDGYAVAPVTLPGSEGGGEIPMLVPDGTRIAPESGLLTVENPGRIILSGPNGVIDTVLGAAAPAGGARRAASAHNGDNADNDDVALDAPKGTTVNPASGIVTLPNMTAFHPDGSRVANTPATPNTPDAPNTPNTPDTPGNPNTPDTPNELGGGSGGCGTGAFGLAALAVFVALAIIRRKAA